MTTPAALHPSSVAAMLRSAEAHELAADVLRTRNPAAAKLHAATAVRFRAQATAEG